MPPVTPQKPRKTLTDHLVIAISPALIMVLVGSLVFLLALILYPNGYPFHLYWTLAWFVGGSVLVTRIAIEVGSERSALFAIGLGGVTALWLIRYVEPPFAGIALLGVIWWCTRKLVLDCTLIDEDEDATGEGLLDSAGIRDDAQPGNAAPPPRRPRGRLVFWNYATKAAREEAIAAQKEEARHSRHRPPAGGPPGAWVVYFSLGVLPLFAIGDALLRGADAVRRQLAFGAITLYIAAALGLLLTTSFLGLRRYLRQKRLTMPGNIVASWLFAGTLLAAGILVFSVLLPRPQASFSLPVLAQRLGTQQLKEHTGKRNFKWGREESTGEEDKDSKDGGGNGKDADGQGHADNHPSQARQDDAQGDPGESKLKLRQLMSPKFNPVWLKRLVNILFAALAAWLLWRYRRGIWAGLYGLWNDLLSLFRRNQPDAPPVTKARDAPPRKPFSAYTNPFLRGGRDRFAPAELVQYTFEGLQAWAANHELARRDGETPLEFVNRLGEAMPEVTSEVHDLACQYTRLAYSGREPEPDSLTHAATLWGYMSRTTESLV